MAISSIHIDTGANGYFAHNSRESKTVNAIFDDEENYCSCSNAEAFEIFKQELSIRSNAYTERTKQKLQSKTVTHLSAIVNFNKEHTPEDIKKLCDYLEKELDTKVIQFAMHRDEGHIAENGEKIKNYHAHIEFMGLDSNGNSIKRKLGKKELINLQTKTAEILNMQRGKNYTELKEKRPKRLNTYPYKRHKEMEAEALKKDSKLLKSTFEQLLATKKDLSIAQSEAREYLKELGATREEFAKLDQLNKELKEQLKTKDLTIEEMQNKFDALKHSLEEKFNELYKEKEHYKAVVELKTVENIELQNDNDKLLTQNYFQEEHIESLEKQNKALISEKELLTSKLSNLEEKNNSSPNMEQYEHYKKQFEIRKKIIIEEAKQIPELEPEKTNLRKLVDYFKNTINEMKEKISNLFKRNEELEAENKDLKEQIYELKRDRIIESGKANPHEAIENVLKHAGLSNLEKLKEMQDRATIMKKEREEQKELFQTAEEVRKLKEELAKTKVIERNRERTLGGR